MDWSKAKNIIIAALLFANITLGALFFSDINAEKARRDSALADAVSLLEKSGISISAEIPRESYNLPVLFVSIKKTSERQSVESYSGIPLVVLGAEGAEVTISGVGEQAAKTISAGEALLRFYSLFKADGGQEQTISSMDMVYLLDLEERYFYTQDTAIPAWRIKAGDKEYHISAYGD